MKPDFFVNSFDFGVCVLFLRFCPVIVGVRLGGPFCHHRSVLPPFPRWLPAAFSMPDDNLRKGKKRGKAEVLRLGKELGRIFMLGIKALRLRKSVSRNAAAHLRVDTFLSPRSRQFWFCTLFMIVNPCPVGPNSQYIRALTEIVLR